VSEPVTTKDDLIVILSKFRARDENALKELQWNGGGIEAHLAFVSGRAEDTAALLCAVIRYLTQEPI